MKLVDASAVDDSSRYKRCFAAAAEWRRRMAVMPVGAPDRATHAATASLLSGASDSSQVNWFWTCQWVSRSLELNARPASLYQHPVANVDRGI